MPEPAERFVHSRVTRLILACGVLSCLALPAVVSRAVAQPGASQQEPAARYPFDPVCPWGRLADGRGMIVRCLQQDEAIALTTGGTSPPLGEAAGGDSSELPELAASAMAPAETMPTEPALPPRRVVLQGVSPAKADTGSLPEAQHQLSRPADRYVQCVEANGGLEQSTAQVTVRFLVRERGRAEGVSVQARRGVSQKAAKCIAEVVDRRYVGFPEAPIVGATLSIDLAAESP